jgi:hypothetical protein
MHLCENHTMRAPEDLKELDMQFGSLQTVSLQLRHCHSFYPGAARELFFCMLSLFLMRFEENNVSLTDTWRAIDL